jgi:hypothetical protein
MHRRRPQWVKTRRLLCYRNVCFRQLQTRAISPLTAISGNGWIASAFFWSGAPAPDPFDWRVARYHEAGHAVIASLFGIEVTCLTLEVCRVRTRRDEIAHWAQAVTAPASSAAEQRFALYPEDVLAMMRRSVWATDRRNAEHWRGQKAAVALPIIALEMIGLVFPRRRGS